MKTTTRLAVSIGMIVVFVGLAFTAFAMGIRPQEGLDLVGGVSVVLEAPAGTSVDVMNRTVDNIRNRVDALGVGESQIGRLGPNDIQVEVPGLGHGTVEPKDGKFCALTGDHPPKNLGCDFLSAAAATAAIQQEGQSRLLSIIGKTARLEERVVVGQATASDQVTACPSSLAQDPKCNDTKFVQCPLSQVDQTTGPCSQPTLSGQTVVYLGNPSGAPCTTFDACPRNKLGPVKITGDAIAKATAVFNSQPSGGVAGWQINFDLTGSGKSLFCSVTTQTVGQQLAIVLDRELESAPNVKSAICGGTGEITGSFSESRAKDLALVLNQGALPVDLKRLNVETVSPTLGKQSLHQGLIAGLVGLVLLMLYLAFYYRLLGIVTWLGMSIWAIFALSLVAVLGRTIDYRLSLAGIAGLIVSLGITADSYIVFYERLKDEVRHGKTLRAAVQPAFKRAWRTIVAADIVTATAAAVLYLVSIGSVRGFALTLGFCTALDLFVVYFFKRPTVFLIARSPFLSNLRGIGLRSGVAADPAPVPAPVAGAAE